MNTINFLCFLLCSKKNKTQIVLPLSSILLMHCYMHNFHPFWHTEVQISIFSIPLFDNILPDKCNATLPQTTQCTQKNNPLAFKYHFTNSWFLFTDFTTSYLFNKKLFHKSQNGRKKTNATFLTALVCCMERNDRLCGTEWLIIQNGMTDNTERNDW